MAKRKWAKGQTMICTEKQRLSNKTQQTAEGEFTCYGKVRSSCSTSRTRRVTIVTNPVISHEWGKTKIVIVRARIMKLNATFNNISVISSQSVLLMEETEVLGENHRPAASHWQLDHIMLYRIHLARAGFELTTCVVIGTDWIDSCKSNYHTIMTTTTSIVIIRRVWRYKRGNENSYIEEEQTTQWPKENKQKDKQRSTKHTYKTKYRVAYKLPVIYYLVCICSGVSLGNVVMIPEPNLQIVSITNKNIDI
jgi:hypothetical protein